MTAQNIVLRIPVEPEDSMPLLLATRCEACAGEGSFGQSRCDECFGRGLKSTREGRAILALVQAFEGGS